MNQLWRCEKNRGTKNNPKNFHMSNPKVKVAIYQDGKTKDRPGLGEKNTGVWIW